MAGERGLNMFRLTISSCLNFHVGTLSLCLYLLFRSPTCARGTHKLIVGQDTGLQAEDSRDS